MSTGRSSGKNPIHSTLGGTVLYLMRVKWYFCRGHVRGLSSSSMPCLSSLSSLDTSLTTFLIASFVHVDSLSTRNPMLHVSTYNHQEEYQTALPLVRCRAWVRTSGNTTVYSCRTTLHVSLNAIGCHSLPRTRYRKNSTSRGTEKHGVHHSCSRTFKVHKMALLGSPNAFGCYFQ